MLPPKPTTEEERLASLHRYDVLDTEAEQAFDDITSLVAHLCDAPIALVSLVDGDRQWFKSKVGLGVQQTSRDVSFCAHAILEKDVFVVQDTHQDARFASNDLVTGDPHLRFYAGAPLTSSDGHSLGTLCVLDRKPRDLSDKQKEALQILARAVMSQMELRVLVRQQTVVLEERRQAQEMLALSENKHRHIAETLQSALLMPPPADQFPGLTVGTFYKGAWDEAEVAGDFFDAFALDGGKVALILGDVTGKGLAAAAYTAETKFALRAFLRELSDPAQAMGRLNHYLIEGRRLDGASVADKDDQYVALLIAIVDTAGGEVLCAGAGAEPPLLVHASGSTEEITTRGAMLGVTPDALYQTVSTRLTPGDLFVLTTDGITEARRRGQKGRRGELFGYERFTEVAAAVSPLDSLDAIAKAIVTAALNFTDGTQADDICLLLARVA